MSSAATPRERPALKIRLSRRECEERKTREEEEEKTCLFNNAEREAAQSNIHF